MYSHTANAYGNRADGDPRKLGMTGYSPDQEVAVDRQRVMELIGRIKQLDDKPVFAHHGGDFGDVHSSNMYLNFLPLQEREEWLSHWVERGELPWMSVEFGLPLYSTIMRGRSGYKHQGHSEPFMTEWAASFIGPEAYALEPEAYRNEVIAQRWDGKDPQAAYQPHIRYDNLHKIIEQAPAYQRVLDRFITRTFQSWRAMGMTGGVVPWHAADFPQVHAVNGPALAFLAGPGGVPKQTVDDEQPMTDRTHHYMPDQILKKQAVFINDHREPKAYSATWQVQLDGQVIAQDTAGGELAVAEILMLPIAAELGGYAGDKRQAGRVTLEAMIAGKSFTDQIDFTVWPRVSKVSGLTVAAFDPRGETTAYLESLGVTVQPWTEGAPPQQVLIIGRHALSDGHVPPSDLEHFVSEGGRLVIFTQDAQWIEHALHLRTAPQLKRQAFVLVPDHPALDGLSHDDLTLWNGSSTTAAGYPDYPGWEWTPDYGWRWGNRHAVTSAAIEKPHRGGWTPLVEQGFDLAYTCLMEMQHGRGLVIFNTFDVEARTTEDPAANRLTRQLLQYAKEAEIDPTPQAAYVGNEQDAEKLRAFGVELETVKQPGDAKGLLIAGRGYEDAAKLNAFVEAGGSAVVLNHESAVELFKLTTQTREDFIGGAADDWPILRGISAGDLRWRAPARAEVLQNSDEVETTAAGQVGRVAQGNGVVYLLAMGPDTVPADEKGYLRFTRWRQARALSQLLNNLGAGFEQNRRFLELLNQPNHYVPLAGTWQIAAVQTLPESAQRAWNPFEPISDEAQQIVGGEAKPSWHEGVVPGYLESYRDDWRWVDGEFIYRKTLQLPEHAEGREAILSLGRVDEAEMSFINGKQVGKSRNWIAGQAHRVPAGVLRAGENRIDVRVWDQGLHGGMAGDPSVLYLTLTGEDPSYYLDDFLDARPTVDGDASDWKQDQLRWKIADDPYRYYRW